MDQKPNNLLPTSGAGRRFFCCFWWGNEKKKARNAPKLKKTAKWRFFQKVFI